MSQCACLCAHALWWAEVELNRPDPVTSSVPLSAKVLGRLYR